MQTRAVAAEDGGLQGPCLDRPDVQQTETITLTSVLHQVQNYLGSEQRPLTVVDVGVWDYGQTRAVTPEDRGLQG